MLFLLEYRHYALFGVWTEWCQKSGALIVAVPGTCGINARNGATFDAFSYQSESKWQARLLSLWE
jgi:hypothetical protein